MTLGFKENKTTKLVQEDKKSLGSYTGIHNGKQQQQQFQLQGQAGAREF
jgi:hypothetical protein